MHIGVHYTFVCLYSRTVSSHVSVRNGFFRQIILPCLICTCTSEPVCIVLMFFYTLRFKPFFSHILFPLHFLQSNRLESCGCLRVMFVFPRPTLIAPAVLSLLSSFQCCRLGCVSCTALCTNLCNYKVTRMTTSYKLPAVSLNDVDDIEYNLSYLGLSSPIVHRMWVEHDAARPVTYSQANLDRNLVAPELQATVKRLRSQKMIT